MTTPTALTDGDLIAAVARADMRAFGQLYDRYSPLMLAVARRMLSGSREAEDLLHDVFVEVWRKAGTYRRERGTVRSWLLVRLRSRALDRLRSPSRSRVVSLDEQPMSDRPQPVAEDPLLAPDRSMVREAVAALPDGQRMVLELAYFGGLSSTEIAKRMEIPVGTVKSRARAGLTNLRHKLGAAGGRER